MIVWVMYDIAAPKRLNRIAKICLRAGVYRVQKSIYVGRLNANELDELKLEIQEVMDLEDDSVYFFPMDRDDFERGNLLGKAFDKALASGEVKALLV